MACGMVFPLAMRGVDLSVGGMFAMCVVAGAVLIKHGLSPWLAVVVILALSAGLSAVNGVVTTYMRLPDSFIVTLASGNLQPLSAAR
jgi:ribose/xylose/arabinose/galactoside ABC-type transport system permease subunit